VIRIVVRGRLDPRFLEPVGAAIVDCGTEMTLESTVRDRAELQGMLDWLFDRGVEIVSVNPLARPPAEGACDCADTGGGSRKGGSRSSASTAEGWPSTADG